MCRRLAYCGKPLVYVRASSVTSVQQTSCPRLAYFDDETRLVVSGPLGDLPALRNVVPESSRGVVQPGEDELKVFRPATPVAV